MDELSLLRGKKLYLTDQVQVLHPTLGNIEEIGHEKYLEYLSAIISTSIDVADILWVEMKIWYEDIKSEWDFFLQKCISNNKRSDIKIFDNNRLLKIESNCAIINEIYRDAFNFFFGLNGEYVLLQYINNDIKQFIICNAKTDKCGGYFIDSSSFKFTQYFYEISSKYLRDINWIKQDYDFLSGGNKKAKKYILENDYKKRKKKNKTAIITLESIVSSLIANGQNYKYIWDYPIYTIYNIYHRYIKINEYKNTTTAYYSGCIDTKKNPINWEKINWSSVINY